MPGEVDTRHKQQKMFTMLEWETENSIAQIQKYGKEANRNIKQMQTQKQVRSDIVW